MIFTDDDRTLDIHIVDTAPLGADLTDAILGGMGVPDGSGVRRMPDLGQVLDPASAAWLYLQELFESDHTHGFNDFMEDDGFMRLYTPGYSEIQVTSDGERMWPRWKAYLFTPDGRGRTVDGPRDAGLAPDRAAELFFRDITASIEQGRDAWSSVRETEEGQ